MTVSRSDQKRLGASLGVLGLLLEENGEAAWDKFAGWELGPSRAPGETPDEVCACGHSIDSHDVICLHVTVNLSEYGAPEQLCWCDQFTPAPRGSAAQDRAAEAKQAARASEQLAEHRADLAEIDRLVQRCLRRMDVAFPPNLSEIQNRRSRSATPLTPAEVALEGMCKSCWRNDEHRTLIDINEKTGLRYYRDYCRWCGSMKQAHGIEPPLDMLVLHHDDKRIPAADFEAAVERVKAAAKKTGKKGKKKKGNGWKAA